mmetsp:Transcript_13030/g.20995  ORF Transcript_13030/g.20995 Transcript_13030/m.20995 type:complete len:225 (+) Transcript_13030:971-1645(+)
MVRFATHKRGQEGMMDIDDLVWKCAAKVVGYDLHVPSQNDEIDIVGILQQVEFFFFLFLFGIFCDGKHVERNIKRLGHMLQVWMIGEYARDLAVEFSSLVTKQEFVQTVIVLAHHDCDVFLLFAPIQVILHPKAFADFLDTKLHRVLIGVHGRPVKMDTLKEEVGGMVRRLFAVYDAASMAVKELGEGSDDALLIWTEYTKRPRSGIRYCCFVFFHVRHEERGR